MAGVERPRRHLLAARGERAVVEGEDVVGHLGDLGAGEGVLRADEGAGLIYAGYTFYQASFQRTPGGQEVTVLSVARDPGMTVSFLGFCVLVAGLVLIFFGS